MTGRDVRGAGDGGAALVEYAFLVTLIAVAAAGAVQALGVQVPGLFDVPFP